MRQRQASPARAREMRGSSWPLSVRHASALVEAFRTHFPYPFGSSSVLARLLVSGLLVSIVLYILLPKAPTPTVPRSRRCSVISVPSSSTGEAF